MSIKEQIDADLKAALLGGDKTLAMTLRGIKAVILNEEVAQGKRESGLPDEEVVRLLQREAKKRQESADLYGQGGNAEKQQAELAEKEVIAQYLPEQLSEEDIAKLVDAAIAEIGNEQQNMGRIIGAVKQKAGGSADGALIAKIVKERLR